MNAQIKISAKGQIVIPKGIRRRLNWDEGQKLEVVETSAGVFLKRPPERKKLSAEEALAKIRALIKYDGPPVTIEEMNETIAEGWRQAALKSDCAKR
jgi:AbrB family looped-hinge helix DNA binding protein